MNGALQKEEVHLVHQRNLSAARDAASEKEALVGQLRNDIENRDARIADLEVQIGRMRKEAAEGEEALARIRIELRDANLQKATAEVHCNNCTTALHGYLLLRTLLYKTCLQGLLGILYEHHSHEQKTIQQKLTIAESQIDMQRKELARLVQIIDSLRAELEAAKREKDEATRKACN